MEWFPPPIVPERWFFFEPVVKIGISEERSPDTVEKSILADIDSGNLNSMSPLVEFNLIRPVKESSEKLQSPETELAVRDSRLPE